MTFERARLRMRLAQNLGANVSNQMVTVVIQLVGVPVLLKAWGAQLYGEWLVLFAIPAYLSMTDLGFSQSAGNDMTALAARQERDRALVVFQSLSALVYAIATAGLCFSGLLLMRVPVGRWFGFDQLDGRSASLVLFFLAAEVFARLPNGVTHAGFRASGENALHVALSSGVRLMQYLAIWVVALGGGGPVTAAAAFLGVRLAGTPAAAVVMFRRHRWLRFGFAKATGAELRRLFRPALANVAIPFAQALNIQGMVVVIGAILGPIAVVVFSTLRTLTRVVFQLVLSISQAAEPELAAAWGEHDRKLMGRLFVHVLRAGLWLATASAAFLALFGPALLAMWTDHRVAMDGRLFAWLLLSASAGVLWYAGLTVLKAANHHVRMASFYVLASLAGLGLAVAFLELDGALADAGLAMFVADAALGVYGLFAASRFLELSAGEAILRSLNPQPLLHATRPRFRRT